MKNIDYLEEFFRKHKLSGKITVRYTSSIQDDECMSDIVFENGDIINISDIIFDVDSDFPNDMFEQWMVSKKENDISFIDWFKENTQYTPNIDRQSIEDYQNEMETIIKDVKNNIDNIFEMLHDDGDSDLDDESEDE